MISHFTGLEGKPELYPFPEKKLLRYCFAKEKGKKIITGVLGCCSAPHLCGKQIIRGLGCEGVFLSLLQGGSNCPTSPGQRGWSWLLVSMWPLSLVLLKLCQCTAGNSALLCGEERDVGPDLVTSTEGEQSGDLLSVAETVLMVLNREQWQSSLWISSWFKHLLFVFVLGGMWDRKLLQADLVPRV